MKGARALVIGQGSIGQRHARLLRELGCSVAVVTRRPNGTSEEFANIGDALKAFVPTYIVVANETARHLETLTDLVESGFRGKVLVEKPLFACSAEIPAFQFEHVAVAYNLRLHPMLGRLKAILDRGDQISTASIYVGSYLPDWRPGTDYRESYSAHDLRGGGVLRDLSHEIDYAAWLFGNWTTLTAAGGQVGPLEINTEDAFTILMTTASCPLLTVHLNYLDRPARRHIVVNVGSDSIAVDLNAGSLSVNGEVYKEGVECDDTYRAQHVAMLSGEVVQLCTVSEAAQTVRTIEIAKEAATSRKWVSR